MNIKSSVQWFLIAVSLVLGGIGAFGHNSLVSNGATKFGTTLASTNMLAEQYIPYVLYNGGYSSGKDIQTTANFGVGTTSTTRMINAGGGYTSGTTTMDLGRACFRFTTDTNQVLYMYLTSSTTIANGGPWATTTVSCF